MARRRLTPAQPGYLAPAVPAGIRAPETKAMPFAAVPDPAPATPQVAPRIAPPIAQVSGQSAEAAALREITASLQAARDEGRMVVEVPLADIAAGYLLRDRIALDREEIEALKASIRSHGQRSPAEITPLDGPAGEQAGQAVERRLPDHGPDQGPDPEGAEGAAPYRFGLISGWRRLRALSELYDETGERRFSTLRALIRPPGEAAASYVAMVEENEIRVGLSYYERARVVFEAARRGVFPDQAAALRALFATASRAKRSKIGSFVTLHADLGDLLRFPAEIPERLGLALVARLRAGGRAELRRALCEARPGSAAAEIRLLETLARPAPAGIARARPPAEILREGVQMAARRSGTRITLTLSGPGVDDRLLQAVSQALRGMVP